MSLNAITARKIRVRGRDFTNSNTGQTIKGFAVPDGPVMFLQGTNLTPGDCLRDQGGKTFIVTSITKRPECLYVALLEYHLTCSISRLAEGQLNAFGRSAEGSPVTVTNSLPISIRQGHAQVPVTADIRQGDMLTVAQISETYLVNAIIRGDTPGLLLLSVIRQDPSGMLSSM